MKLSKLFTFKSNLSILSLAVATSMYSVQTLAEQEIPTITVEETELSDVSGEEIKSADLAEALAKKVAGASIIRRSGIANDVIIRGQNRDNINVLIDDAKIYGACPNKMDPPTSHVLTNNIESVDIIEGPYDVENFGTLSGAVKISTKKPEKELHGEISANFGRWGYRKYAASFSGGNDTIRALVSVSKENSDQYEDGDGRNFAEQLEHTNSTTMAKYKDQFRDMEAYEKKTFMGKFFVNLADNHELAVSYTANRSDDVLYPSSMMDALYDDSNILDINYSITNLGAFSKKLDIEYYDSDVDHPMSTKYRNSSGANFVNEKISHLDTRIQGIKIKNVFDIDPTTEVTIGLDSSLRNWNGQYIGNGMTAWITGIPNIEDVDTRNTAIFAELEKRFVDLTVNAGLRYDDTSVKTPNATLQNNDYQSLSAFARGTYQFNDSTRFFVGAGKSSRVPDGRELYFRMTGLSAMMAGPLLGTPTLDDTDNYEIDFGVEHNFQNLTVKTKLFHSWLKDYIYYNSSKMTNRYENIDATIYGLDISGVLSLTDDLYLDFGLAYQRGKKDDPLAGQTDTDLANITPLKANLALNYDYMSSGTAKVELVAADSWDKFDADNGEQAIDGYAVLNLKVKHNVTKNIEITAGLDNVFDKTYAVSNTYKDLLLLADGTGTVMLMNEPGRYYYINGAYKF